MLQKDPCECSKKVRVPVILLRKSGPDELPPQAQATPQHSLGHCSKGCRLSILHAIKTGEEKIIELPLIAHDAAHLLLTSQITCTIIIWTSGLWV